MQAVSQSATMTLDDDYFGPEMPARGMMPIPGMTPPPSSAKPASPRAQVMDPSKPTVLVTGIAGNLGLRLLPLLADYQVVGVDLNPPAASPSLSSNLLDLALEESCRELFLLLKKVRPFAVLHLAFVIDPVRSGCA